MLDTIGTLDTSASLRNSLGAPLNQALALLNDDNPDNDNAACSKLQAFVNQVNTKAGKGLTTEQAAELIEEASSIKDGLGC